MNTAEMLAYLAEVDARGLYLPAGYPSMHAYCERELRLSEDAANKRIRVARKARECPALFAAIAGGRLHLSGVILLASQMTPENADELIKAAEGRSKAEIEKLIAARQPSTESLPMVETLTVSASEPAIEPVAARAASVARNQPAPGPVATIPKRSKVEPIARSRYLLRPCLGQATLDKLHHVQALLSHTIPDGDLQAVLDRVLDLAIGQLEKKKFGDGSKAAPPQRCSKSARHIPTHTRQAVWRRDGGQCTFESESGYRCTERKLLEFDHVEPVAHGGRDTVENLRLLCRAHNQWAAEQVFGKELIRRKKSEAREGRETAARKQSEARAAEIIPGLRNLGFSADEARLGAAHGAQAPDATLEQRFRAALSYLRPRRVTHATAPA